MRTYGISSQSKRFECEVKRESYPSPRRSFRRVVRSFLPFTSNLLSPRSPHPLRCLLTLLSSPPINSIHLLSPRSLRVSRNRSQEEILKASISARTWRLLPPFFPFSRERGKEIHDHAVVVVDHASTRLRGVGRVEESGHDRTREGYRSERASKSCPVTDEIDARCLDPRSSATDREATW